jgi:hypothetical protein
MTLPQQNKSGRRGFDARLDAAVDVAIREAKASGLIIDAENLLIAFDSTTIDQLSSSMAQAIMRKGAVRGGHVDLGTLKRKLRTRLARRGLNAAEAAVVSAKDKLAEHDHTKALFLEKQSLSSRLKILDGRIALLGNEKSLLRQELVTLIGPELMETVDACAGRARELVLPRPVTAANTEALLMSFAWFIEPFYTLDLTSRQTTTVLDAAYEAESHVRKLVTQFKPLVRPGLDLRAFAHDWLGAAFARLEVSHRLAASLCLTDSGDVEVTAPWAAWSLVMPDGLIGDFARIWCHGTEPAFLVGRSGTIVGMAEQRALGLDSGAAFDMARSLIRGACLALSNPDDFRKENQHGPTARTSHKSSRSGPPDLQQARFLLSAPVKVDLREHLAAVLSGRKGASPTVQFLVRGHWRNQAHGPKASLRKTIWIQPFWKGPEGSRVLLRQHRIEEPQL